MPIRMHQEGWRDAIKTTHVTYEGDSAVIEYYYQRITPQMIDRFQRRATQSGGASLEELCRTLEGLIASWDVIGTPPVGKEQLLADLLADADEAADDLATQMGAPPTRVYQQQRQAAPGMYPIETWALMQLPLDFLNKVSEAIFAAGVPNSPKTGRR